MNPYKKTSRASHPLPSSDDYFTRGDPRGRRAAANSRPYPNGAAAPPDSRPSRPGLSLLRFQPMNWATTTAAPTSEVMDVITVNMSEIRLSILSIRRSPCSNRLSI